MVIYEQTDAVMENEQKNFIFLVNCNIDENDSKRFFRGTNCCTEINSNLIHEIAAHEYLLAKKNQINNNVDEALSPTVMITREPEIEAMSIGVIPETEKEQSQKIKTPPSCKKHSQSSSVTTNLSEIQSQSFGDEEKQCREFLTKLYGVDDRPHELDNSDQPPTFFDVIQAARNGGSVDDFTAEELKDVVNLLNRTKHLCF